MRGIYGYLPKYCANAEWAVLPGHDSVVSRFGSLLGASSSLERRFVSYDVEDELSEFVEANTAEAGRRVESVVWDMSSSEGKRKGKTTFDFSAYHKVLSICIKKRF